MKLRQLINEILTEQLNKEERNLTGQIASQVGIRMTDLANFIEKYGIDVNKLKLAFDSNDITAATIKNAVAGDLNNLSAKTIIARYSV